jgi:hypothetical protein
MHCQTKLLVFQTQAHGVQALNLELDADDLTVIAYHPCANPASGEVDDPESWYWVLIQLPGCQRDMVAHAHISLFLTGVLAQLHHLFLHFTQHAGVLHFTHCYTVFD